MVVVVLMLLLLQAADQDEDAKVPEMEKPPGEAPTKIEQRSELQCKRWNVVANK